MNALEQTIMSSTFMKVTQTIQGVTEKRELANFLEIEPEMWRQPWSHPPLSCGPDYHKNELSAISD